jgi:RNA polymerase sigma-70 factor (ECF subfamily)
VTIQSRPLQLSTVASPIREVATKETEERPATADDCLRAYQRELDFLIGSLRRLGASYPDIEDMLHEVFLVMFARWNDYDTARPLRPWLFGIAFRVAAAQRRKGAREVPTENQDAQDQGALPDDQLAAGRNRELLLRALTHIPIERRAVLIMHEVDETPMRDIAHHLGIPLFTAYSRLRKARQELDATLVRLEKGPRRVR